MEQSKSNDEIKWLRRTFYVKLLLCFMLIIIAVLIMNRSLDPCGKCKFCDYRGNITFNEESRCITAKEVFNVYATEIVNNSHYSWSDMNKWAFDKAFLEKLKNGSLIVNSS